MTKKGINTSHFLSLLLLRAIAECFARLSHGLGVCPSVRLCVYLSGNL